MINGLKTMGARVLNSFLLRNFVFRTALISLVVFAVIESCEYKAVFGFAEFFADNPVAFLANYAIVFASYIPTWFFRRRLFTFALISAPWIIIGIANGVILGFRMTPLTAADIGLIGMVVSLLPQYFSVFQIVLMGVGLAALLAAFVLAFIFGPRIKEKIRFRKSLAASIITLTLTVSLYAFALNADFISTRFLNLWDAYKAYGVPYAFGNTWLNQGIKKPVDYGKAAMMNIFGEEKLDKILEDAGKDKKAEDKPNIIFLQLESFIDPTEIKGLELSGEPIPFYRSLKKKFSTGYLTVPVVGGGTANTEFEIQTGMNVSYFGPGEYPYKTVLKEKTVETFAYNLRGLGYATHIMHNHRGSFYNRNAVFKNMGYDDFTSVEYMPYIQRTERAWERDFVLAGEIEDLMKSTKKSDYIYAISVQGHGEYPNDKAIKNPRIRVLSEEDEGQKNAYEYYIHQLMDMDDFVKDLTERLSAIDEKTVLVLYGDHLPGIGIEASDMKSGSVTKTDYVIWTNFDAPAKKKNLAAYQLSAYVQDFLSENFDGSSAIGGEMPRGIMANFHAENMGKADYYKNLRLLEYDMLYGDNYIMKGKNLYPETDMKMGFREIAIDSIALVGGEYYIKGKGFTSYSKISLDGKVLKTKYLSPNILKLEKEIDEEDIDDLKISQVEGNNNVLSETE